MSTRITAVAATAALALLLGCTQVAATPSPSPSSAPTAPPTPAPTATLPPTAPPYALIKASDVCNITSMTDRHEDGNYIITEHFSCVRTASDPRVSGQLEFDVDSIFEPEGAPTAHWQTDSYVLTNDDGVWQGVARGVVSIWPDIGVVNYGRADYVGTGAYEGLQFIEVVAAGDAGGLILGYITGD